MCGEECKHTESCCTAHDACDEGCQECCLADILDGWIEDGGNVEMTEPAADGSYYLIVTSPCCFRSVRLFLRNEEDGIESWELVEPENEQQKTLQEQCDCAPQFLEAACPDECCKH